MKIMTVPLFLFILLTSSLSEAKQSSVYPGVYQATINSIKATNKIVLTIDVWAGFQRQFIVTLPHLNIPIASKNAPMCQLKLIKAGFKYTKKLINSAKKIETKNIKMQDSTTKMASAEIYLDDKKLSTQLIKKNYARSDKIKHSKPWCSDEN